MKTWKMGTVVRVLLAVSTVVGIYLVLKKPQPFAEAQAPAVVAANAQSFEEKLRTLEIPQPVSYTEPAEVHITSEEASAALAQSAATPPPSQPLTPNSDLGSRPAVQAEQVRFVGDQVRGQFRATLAGRDVWITVAGRLGSQNGYATFYPTEFKVGDVSVPVSLVNGALQRKMEEQKESLKLPESVGSLRVENGELVITKK